MGKTPDRMIKVTMYLYEVDVERIKRYRGYGYTEFIRDLVHERCSKPPLSESVVEIIDLDITEDTFDEVEVKEPKDDTDRWP